jgi:tetratricopeptide (TPR) repeat protein
LRHAEAEVHRLGNSANWLLYASALRARQQYPKAVEAAQNAVERDSRNLDAQYELAHALIDAGRPAEAAAPLELVLAKDRSFDREQALFLLGRAQAAGGDSQAARVTLEEVGSRSSRPEYLYELASLQGLAGDREPAARTLQRIIHEAELVPPYLQREVRPWVRKAQAGLRKLGY